MWPGIRRHYSFRLIVLYTKKAPQLSAQELIALTKNMAAATAKCCPLNQERICLHGGLSKHTLGCMFAYRGKF